jgi:hypothetical protein
VFLRCTIRAFSAAQAEQEVRAFVNDARLRMHLSDPVQVLVEKEESQ